MPTEHEVDQGMHDKGYRYKLTPLNADFKPLFTKTLAQLGPLMRDYKDTKFLVHPIRYDWDCIEEFKIELELE